jgi:hypothetical protein
MTAKEHAGAYGNFAFDPRAVSADAEEARISMQLSLAENEREFVQRQFRETCAETEEIVIEIQKGGAAQTRKHSPSVNKLLSWYSKSYLNSPGFFDYIANLGAGEVRVVRDFGQDAALRHLVLHC